MKKFHRLLVVGVWVVACLVQASGARAGTISVNTTNMGDVIDGNCGLMEAVYSVNQSLPSYHGCTGWTGIDDRIVFTQTGVRTYAAPDYISIFASVTIVGNGQANTIIQAKAGINVVEYDPYLRDVNVTIQNLTINKHSLQVPEYPGLMVSHEGGFSTYLVMDRVKVTGFNTNDTIQVISWRPYELNTVPSAMFHGVDSSITLNSGCGIHVIGRYAFASLERSTVSGNLNHGVDIHNGSFTSFFSTFEDNFTSGNGGGIKLTFDEVGDPDHHSTVDIPGSLVADNHADGDGGGIYFAGGNGTDLPYTTVTGNSATRGGGIFSHRTTPEGYLRMQYSTIVYNVASTHGGGVYDTAMGTGSPQINATIIAKNIRAASFSPHDNGTDFYYPGPAGIDLAYSLLGTHNGTLIQCYDLPTGSPCSPALFPPLGGTFDPMIEAAPVYVGGASAVYRLLSGSPAIDFAPNLAGILYDQRGFDRPTDGDFLFSSEEYDIGAYERGAGQLLGGSTTQTPAAVTYVNPADGKTYIEVFIRGSDSHLHSKKGVVYPSGMVAGGNRDPWQPEAGFQFAIDANTARAPSVVPMTSNEIYLFVTDTNLRGRRRLTNGTYTAWENLGNNTTIGSAPAAAKVGSNVWVFVRGTNNQLKYKIRTGSTWGSWNTSLGTTAVQDSPSAAYLSGTNKIYVFSRKSGVIAYRSCTPSSCTWSSWTNIDTAPMVSGPSVSARSGNLEVCARNTFARLSCNTFNGSTWSGWTERSTSDSISTGPGSVTRGNVVDVFTTRSDGQVERLETPW